MKKLSAIFVAVAMMAVLATPSFAILRKDMQSIRGTVTYVNSARTEITVKDSSSGKDLTFTSPGLGAAIVAGTPVVILYKTGTTVAKTVRVIVPKKAGGRARAAAAAPAYSAPKAMSAEPAYTMPKTTAPAKKSSW